MVRRFLVTFAGVCLVALGLPAPTAAQTATITGTVRNASAGGSPVGFAGVFAYRTSDDSFAASATCPSLPSNFGTCADGTYQITGLSTTSSYIIVTSNSAGLVDQYYKSTAPAVSCGGCRPSTSGATPLSTTTVLSGIDFNLVSGPRLSGRVTDAAGNPLVGVSVGIYLQNNAWFSAAFPSTLSDPAGTFVSGPALPPGTYAAFTSSAFTTFPGGVAYIDEIYNNVPCPGGGCGFASGAGIAIGTTDVTGIDFALVQGGRITGTVTNASTAAPVSGASVTVFNSVGNFVAFASTLTDGTYKTGGLPNDNYYARANANGLINQVYDGVICANCSVTSGTPINVASTAGASGINFALAPGATISGALKDPSNNPIVGMNVQALTSTGGFVTSVNSVATSGIYTISGLAPGTYYIKATGNNTFIPRVYPSLDCISCDVSGGDSITVTSGQTVSGKDIQLAIGGSLSGVVRDDTTSALLSGIPVSLLNATGGTVKTTTTTSGAYSFGGLLAGTYFVRTGTSATTTHIPEIYAGAGNRVVCFSCSVFSSGTSVAVAIGSPVSGIDFSLRPGGSFSGNIKNSSGANLQFVSVSAVDAGNVSFGSGFTDASGNYTVSGLPGGTFFARTFNSIGLIDQAYDGVPCQNCSAFGTTPIPVTVGAQTTGINFVLAPGGRISGKMTDSTGTPLASQSVFVYNGINNFVTSGFTGSDGRYTTFAGLPTENYFVVSGNQLGYINQVYNGIACFNCQANSGTPVPVTAGSTTTGIDLALSAGARISGNVRTPVVPATTPATFNPVAGAFVQLYQLSASGFAQFVTSTSTNSLGDYTLGGFPTGSYFVRTSNSLGFIDRLFDNSECVGCDAAAGTPVTATAGTITPNINFTLQAGGAISGSVTVAGSSPVTPLSGVTVQVYNAFGFFVSSVNTVGNGTFTFRGLASGTYFVRTSGSVGYINQVYSTGTPILCGSCSVTSGTPVSVTVGSTTPGVNFALNPGGTLRGTVRTTDATPVGIQGVSISVLNSNGSSSGFGFTDASGNYVISGLLGGTFFVRTSNSQGFVDRVYNDLECVGCTVTNGTPVTITPGVTTATIDFALPRGGRIRGRVLDTASNPLQSVSVQVYRSNGALVTSGQTAADGRYVSGTGLPAGDYFVKTFNQIGFVDRLYNNTVCLNCSVISGQPVTVAAGATVNDIDFALAAGGNISGTVLSAGGNPLQGVFVQIFNDTGGSSVATASTNGAGKFVAKGLPTGSYFAKVSNAPGFIDQLYSGTACLSCAVTLGTPIPVTVGTTTENINFTLTQGGRIGGTITAASGGGPIQSVSVQIYNASGQFMTSGFTSSAGTYLTNGGLPAGTYYARTFNSIGFINQLHSGIACQFCTTSAGTPIPVTLGATTTVNFSLATGGSIGGRITDGTNPLEGVTVTITTTSGLFMGGASTNASGVYSVGGLPTGSYVARTSNALGFIDEQHSDRVCLSCSSSAGTPIPVTAGAATTGIDFSLATGGRISGTVTDAGTGAPLSGITVDIFSASNFFVTSANTDNVGNYLTRAGLPEGNYYARTRNSSGYINVTYPTNTCLGCSVTVGTPILVTGSGTTAGINFVLTPGGRIAGTITDAATGVPLQGISVSIFLPSGTFVAGSFTNGNGVFATQGLPTGTYYARTNNARGYVNRLYDAIDCVRCAVASGTPINVTLGATTTGVNFALALGARIGGRVVDAATSLPIAGVFVTIVDRAGFWVGGGTTNSSGDYLSSMGLVAGKYYARTNNQLGYVNKLYDGVSCFACNAVTGTPIDLTGTTSNTGINFSLVTGGRISGTVRATGAALADVSVNVFSTGGTFLTSAFSGTSGEYVTGEGLPEGSYFLVTQNRSGFIEQLYNNKPCVSVLVAGALTGCTVTRGDVVNVSPAVPATGRDFDLTRGGRISGRITDRVTGDAVANLQLNVYDTGGTWVSFAFTDGLGDYTTASGLPTGTYFVLTQSFSRINPYVNKLYPNITCPGCDPTTGTGVAVTVGATTPNINIAVDRGGTAIGRVTTSGGTPIAGAVVRFFNSAGVPVSRGNTDDAGDYSTLAALPPGTYYARTFNGLGFVDVLYDQTQVPLLGVCLACDVTLGTPITFTGTETEAKSGVNFSLAAGGKITGTVTRSSTGAPIAGVKIRIFNTSFAFVGETFTNGVGAYTTPGLPPGDYFLRTANTAGLIDKLHPNAPCAPCTALQGTPVVVTNGNVTPNINFALGQGALVSGTIRNETTGAPLRGVTVSFFLSDAADAVAIGTSDPSDATGYYQISLPAGTYFVAPNPVAGFRPALAAGLTHRPWARSTVTVETDTETTGIGFALVSCAPVTVNPSTLPLAAQGQLYNAVLTATGGVAPYTFSISDGNANTGLALAASGLLAGAPVFAGAGTFTVAAADANQCGGARAFTLTACGFFLSTSSLSTTANAGSGSVTLTASATDCPWVITINDPWITVTSAANGTGNATVNFAYTFNATGATRSGSLRIGGQLFTVTQGSPSSSAAFGVVDTPAQGAAGISGSLAVTGWALDDIGVARLTISRDPVAGEAGGQVYIGDATLVEGARPDVAAANPTLPNNTRAGWGYLLLTNMLPNQGNGSYTLHIDAIDAEGATTRLGSRTFVADNANAVTPFGAIDTPGQGATVSGTNFVNFGWALTPNPKSIATDGSTITVFVDSAPAGNPTYNNFRADVAGLFPGLANTAGAIGFRMFDTTTLTNGVHTISWVVFDDAGQAQGIGSRYFTVNNILASQRFAPPPLASMRGSAAIASAAVAPSGPPASLRVGFDRTQPMLELGADALGARFVAVGQLGRMEVRFGQACGVVRGVQIANGERTPLPVGSTLDASGSFHWMPGPAFLGTYQLEFSMPSCHGGDMKVPVTVAVLPGR